MRFIGRTKKEETKIKKVLAYLLVPVLAVSVLSRAPVSRATSETQQKIKEAEEEKKRLEEEKNKNKENLDNLNGKRDSLRGELNVLDGEMEEVSDHLEDLEDQIEAKLAEIEETRKALEDAIATEEKQYDGMVSRVRAKYERGEINYFSVFAGDMSFSEFLKTADYFIRIENYDRQKLDEFKENRRHIEEQKAMLEKEEEELEQLREETRADQEKISGLIGQAKDAINKYSGEIATAEAEAKKIEEDLAAKEKDLAYLKQKLAEEMAMSRKAANGTWRDISEVTFDENDRYLLANLIYCEAGGEPYDGQVAVGAVVINRVLSGVYPDTVSGVIYQKSQFSPAGSGRLAIALAQNKATASCYQAADEAMSGITNVGTCVYFRTPIEGLSGISIGGHIFY